MLKFKIHRLFSRKNRIERRSRRFQSEEMEINSSDYLTYLMYYHIFRD